MPPLKFLSEEDIQAMHEATLRVLNEAGVFWTHKPSLKILTDAGCTVKDNRVFFPPDLVMDSIAKANKRPVIRGRNGQVNEIGGGNLYFHNPLKLLRLLVDRSVTPSVVAGHNLTIEDAEVIVVLASLLHDIGMSIHRVDHELYSLFLARPKLRELLEGIYDLPTLTIHTSEILHAIISHRAGGQPITLEAGVVRVADALDMAQGRSRIPFQAGKVDIHSISATAIEQVIIEQGEMKPIRIVVRMNNSAGIFQLDELLKEKLDGSGLEPYVEVEATVEGESEKKLIQTFRI